MQPAEIPHFHENFIENYEKYLPLDAYLYFPSRVFPFSLFSFFENHIFSNFDKKFSNFQPMKSKQEKKKKAIEGFMRDRSNSTFGNLIL